MAEPAGVAFSSKNVAWCRIPPPPESAAAAPPHRAGIGRPLRNPAETSTAPIVRPLFGPVNPRTPHVFGGTLIGKTETVDGGPAKLTQSSFPPLSPSPSLPLKKLTQPYALGGCSRAHLPFHLCLIRDAATGITTRRWTWPSYDVPEDELILPRV